MTTKVYNQKGEEVGDIKLPREVFGIEVNADLLHQVIVAQAANRRRVIAHTKDRSAVRGGGRKPWRQKHTGRARHGSRRSPIWIGGGVTFGPTKERNFKKDINKRMKRKAVLMTLSAKAKENLLVVLDSLSLEKFKTKLMADVLRKLPVKGSALIVLPDNSKGLVLAARNISQLEIREAKNLNALDLLSVKYLIVLKDAIKVINENFVK